MRLHEFGLQVSDMKEEWNKILVFHMKEYHSLVYHMMEYGIQVFHMKMEFHMRMGSHKMRVCHNLMG